MISVRFSTCEDDFFERQLPGMSKTWGACQFSFNERVEECDYWVIFNGLSEVEKTYCPPNNTLLITGEPPSVRLYARRFVDQFASVITCQQNIKHKSVILSQQGLPWHVGRRLKTNSPAVSSTCYDDYVAMGTVIKTKLISVISSNKRVTTGHEKRLAFVETLRRRFGAQIDIFGKGFNEIEDKWQALAPYKYHIVLENSSFEDYWTEKLADAYLAFCYPIYYGCPNIYNYFEADMLSVINIAQPQQAVEVIEQRLAADKCEARIEHIQKARQKILNEYNIFALIDKYVQSQQHKHRYSITRNRPARIILKPEPLCISKQTHVRRMISRLLIQPLKKSLLA